MVAHTKPQVTVTEVLSWPPMVPLWPSAGRAVGCGRARTYDLHRRGEFPVQVVCIGSRLRVRRSDLIAYLGLDAPAA